MTLVEDESAAARTRRLTLTGVAKTTGTSKHAVAAREVRASVAALNASMRLRLVT